MKEIISRRAILVIIVILAALIVAYIAYQKALLQKQTSNVFAPEATSSQELRTFQSKNFEFNIMLPPNTTANEEAGRVIIVSKLGKVYIDRNGTNFSGLNEYLADLDKNNKAAIENQEQKFKSNYQTKVRLIKYQSGEVQKSVVIFTNNWVYNFYTNDLILYSALDQIAQSFRYTP